MTADAASQRQKLTCGLNDRDGVTLRFIFEDSRQQDFILRRWIQTSQYISVITST